MQYVQQKGFDSCLIIQNKYSFVKHTKMIMNMTSLTVRILTNEMNNRWWSFKHIKVGKK